MPIFTIYSYPTIGVFNRRTLGFAPAHARIRTEPPREPPGDIRPTTTEADVVALAEVINRLAAHCLVDGVRYRPGHRPMRGALGLDREQRGRVAAPELRVKGVLRVRPVAVEWTSRGHRADA